MKASTVINPHPKEFRASKTSSTKKIVKNLKPEPLYLLHRLKLSIIDNFIENSLDCIKKLDKNSLKKYASMVRYCFMLALLHNNTDEILLALMNKGIISVFDGPIFGFHKQFGIYPTFFLLCIFFNRMSLVKRFLSSKKGKYLARSSWQSFNSLHIACSKDPSCQESRFELVKLLIDHDASPSVCISFEDFIKLYKLHVLSESGKYEVFKQAIDHEYVRSKFIYAFEISAASSDVEVTGYLIGKISRSNVFADSCFSLLLSESVDLAILFLKANVSSNQKTVNHETALHLAVRRGDFDLVVTLLVYGASIDSLNDRKNSALHYAAKYEMKDIFQYLLFKKAKITSNREGKTPFDIAKTKPFFKSLEGYNFEVLSDKIFKKEQKALEYIRTYPLGANKNLKFLSKGFLKTFSSFDTAALNNSRTCPALRNTLSGGPSSTETTSKFSFFNNLTSFFRISSFNQSTHSTQSINESTEKF